jgi:hypothetical protein
MLTPENYDQVKRQLDDPSKQFSDEAKLKAQMAVDEYETDLLDSLKQKINPNLPIQPQALAIQPATGHPEGDRAAQEEWVRGPLDNPNGRVIVYDAPLDVVQKRILSSPSFAHAIGFQGEATPDAVSKIKAGDSIHQAANDFMWRETADAAVKAGKTPYRYSRAPWMQGGPNAGLLDTLSTKLKAAVPPALDKATAFVMGVDDLAGFGAAHAAASAGLLDDHRPSDVPVRPTAIPGAHAIGCGNDEFVGGSLEGADQFTPGQHLDRIEENNKGAYRAGEVAGVGGGMAKLGAKAAASTVEAAGRAITGDAAGGVVGRGARAVEGSVGKGIDALHEWNPANSLWEYIMGNTPTKGVMAPIVNAAARSAVAGGTSQALTEGARAGANYAATGDTGTTLGDAATRTAVAAGGAGLLGAPFGAAEGAANWISRGEIFKKLPWLVEKLGGVARLGQGFVDPGEVAAARTAGEARDIPVKPQDIIAEKLEGPIKEAAKQRVTDTNAQVAAGQRAFYPTAEGAEKLPANNTFDAGLQQMRERTSLVARKGLSPVGVPGAVAPIKGIFNTNIGAVSVRRMPGAREMTPEEAEAFFTPFWRRQTLSSAERGERVGRAERAMTKTTPETEQSQQYRDELDRQYDKRQFEEDRVQAWRRTPDPALSPASDESSLARSNELSRYYQRDPANLSQAEPDQIVRGSRQPTEGEKAGAPKVTAREVPSARNMGPDESRWQRTGPPGAATGQGDEQWRQDIKEGSFAKRLRAQGITKVYVQPREYSALSQEVAIRQLKRKGQENQNDRDLGKIYRGALDDRQQRLMNGQPGGWAIYQRNAEQAIDAAKTAQRLVAPKSGGAYSAALKVANHGAGSSKRLTAMMDTAQRAGGNAPDLVRAQAIIKPIEELQRRGGFGQAPHGRPRSLLGLTALSDAALLRGVYPIARGVTEAGPGAAQVARAVPAYAQSPGEKRQEEGLQAAAPAAPPPKPEAPKRKRTPRYQRREDQR